ncbi:MULTISPECIES: hypothetical protein [Cupriavidus]
MRIVSPRQIYYTLRHQVPHLAFALSLPEDAGKCHIRHSLAEPLEDIGGQTMTLTTRVLSSSVMKMTPFAVAGRWRTVTMPAARDLAKLNRICVDDKVRWVRTATALA